MKLNSEQSKICLNKLYCRQSNFCEVASSKVNPEDYMKTKFDNNGDKI